MKTKEYRKLQFDKISTVYNEYKTKVKFYKPNGETNYMDITNKELYAIIKLLTDKKVYENKIGEFQIK